MQGYFSRATPPFKSVLPDANHPKAASGEKGILNVISSIINKKTMSGSFDWMDLFYFANRFFGTHAKKPWEITSKLNHTAVYSIRPVIIFYTVLGQLINHPILGLLHLGVSPKVFLEKIVFKAAKPWSKPPFFKAMLLKIHSAVYLNSYGKKKYGITHPSPLYPPFPAGRGGLGRYNFGGLN